MDDVERTETHAPLMEEGGFASPTLTIRVIEMVVAVTPTRPPRGHPTGCDSGRRVLVTLPRDGSKVPLMGGICKSISVFYL